MSLTVGRVEFGPPGPPDRPDALSALKAPPGIEDLRKHATAQQHTYVIAEAGACHDGAWKKAVGLVEEAQRAGADAVKFQWTSDPARMAARRHAPQYQDVYARYLVWAPPLQMGALARAARTVGLDFMCSVYLPEDVPVVAKHVKTFKVASFEAEDAALLAAHVPFLEADRGARLLVSQGLGAASPWSHFPKALWSQVQTMHCVSAYPAPVDEMNLRVLRWGGRPGLSDHTDPAFTWTGALAVAAGATILEAHLRLDETDTANPDWAHAMSPRQFAEYVKHVRFAERALGHGDNGMRAQPSEAAMAAYKVVTEEPCSD